LFRSQSTPFFTNDNGKFTEVSLKKFERIEGNSFEGESLAKRESRHEPPNSFQHVAQRQVVVFVRQHKKDRQKEGAWDRKETRERDEETTTNKQRERYVPG
jgi:hypothetical protein